jgi:hypothetical protein
LHKICKNYYKTGCAFAFIVTASEKGRTVCKLGVHFRRQQVIAGFIVDFYCHKSPLTVENPENTIIERAGSPDRLFQFCLGGEEKSTYEANFITCPQNLLNASPTSLGRLVNVFYEPFLSRTTSLSMRGNVNSKALNSDSENMVGCVNTRWKLGYKRIAVSGATSTTKCSKIKI